MSLFSTFEEVSTFAPEEAQFERVDFLGHSEIEALLLKAYQTGQMPHAVIFGGLKGIGKATLALRIIKFLLDQPLKQQEGPSLFGADDNVTELDIKSLENFEIPESSKTAQQIAAGSHPDFLSLPDQSEGAKKTISVSEIREGVKFLRLTPSQSAWRCVLIDGAHEMTIQAQNALLKVLEEPPKNTLLVIVTDHPGKLLPTIKSRCRKYDFKSMSDAQILPIFKKTYPDIGEIQQQQILKLAQGSLGSALYFAKHDAVGIYLDLLDQLKKLKVATDFDVLSFCQKYTKKDQERNFRLVREFTLLWVYKMNHYVTLGKIPLQLVEAENDFLMSLRDYKYPKRVHDLWAQVLDIFDECERFNLDRKTSLQNVMFTIHDVLKAH